MNVFHTFHDVIKPEWAFATWEANKDNVLHLHLCFQHTGRIDIAKKKLLNLLTFDDAILTTIKLERTRSFQNLFRYYMKEPLAVFSTDIMSSECQSLCTQQRFGMDRWYQTTNTSS